jgi:hypothetical protein
MRLAAKVLEPFPGLTVKIRLNKVGFWESVRTQRHLCSTVQTVSPELPDFDVILWNPP